MAFAYQSKTWTITGEKEFEGGTKLLNPSLSVKQVVLVNDGVYIQLEAHENGGVYPHNVSVSQPILGGETDIDVIVADAIAAAFPTAVMSV